MVQLACIQIMFNKFWVFNFRCGSALKIICPKVFCVISISQCFYLSKDFFTIFAAAMPKARSKIQISNRRASFDYTFLETYTAGIVLTGTEIKSIRAGKVSLADAFCYFDTRGQLYVKGMNVAQYFWGSWGQHEPVRDRKLLLTRRELRHLRQETRLKGNTIVAVKLFVADNGYAKLLIALAKGKKEYDKRQNIKEKDIRREMERGD